MEQILGNLANEELVYAHALCLVHKTLRERTISNNDEEFYRNGKLEDFWTGRVRIEFDYYEAFNTHVHDREKCYREEDLEDDDGNHIDTETVLICKEEVLDPDFERGSLKKKIADYFIKSGLINEEIQIETNSGYTYNKYRYETLHPSKLDRSKAYFNVSVYGESLRIDIILPASTERIKKHEKEKELARLRAERDALDAKIAETESR